MRSRSNIHYIISFLAFAILGYSLCKLHAGHGVACGLACRDAFLLRLRRAGRLCIRKDAAIGVVYIAASVGPIRGYPGRTAARSRSAAAGAGSRRNGVGHRATGS